MRSFNLRQVKLRSGEEYRDEIELELEPFELGGERYLPVPDKVPAELAVTKATTGTVFELGFTTRRGSNDLARSDWLQLRRSNVGRRSTLPVVRAQLLALPARALGATG